jgi:phage-related protein
LAYNLRVKRVRFLGNTRKEISNFPREARKAAGFELGAIQQGSSARDSKPMPSVGPGVQELRVWVQAGTFRVIYLARMEEAIYVLHAFEKKTEKTAQADIDLARERYKELLRRRG